MFRRFHFEQEKHFLTRFRLFLKNTWHPFFNVESMLFQFSWDTNVLLKTWKPKTSVFKTVRRNMQRCSTGNEVLLSTFNVHEQVKPSSWYSEMCTYFYVSCLLIWFACCLNRLADFAKLYDVIKNERNKCVNLIQTSTQVSYLQVVILSRLYSRLYAYSTALAYPCIPFLFQDFISNSLYYLPLNPYDVSLENWYWINLKSPNCCISQFSSLVCVILYWYCKEKFCLGHSWEFKGWWRPY